MSLIWIVQTALLLGNGGLRQYGVERNNEQCHDELFRAARIMQTTDDFGDPRLIEERIDNACYNGQARRHGDSN